MKTIEDYMNDRRIVNDPLMANALEPIKEIHAARLMMQDETAGMTPAEISALYKKEINEYFANKGQPPPEYVDLTGQGKLKPRKVVGV